MRTDMSDSTTTMRHLRTLGKRALGRRDAALPLDYEAMAIRAVTAALLIGAASLLFLNPAAHRNSDTTTERVARITPVGSVTVAAATPARETIAATAANGS
jgi:hypothetical protein